MSTATPAILSLARRLIALEPAPAPAEEGIGAAIHVCNKLRVPLVKLAGVAGFRSLMTRALALATAEVPWLKAVQVQADGSLEECDAPAGNPGAVPGSAAGVAVVAELLGLLVTFIGEPLTLGLVHAAWPDASVQAHVDETDWRVGGPS